MVNQQDQNMEDIIIQVFEEHEEQFFFPVTSQKDARAFIKALHIKGIQYDNICEEIGEFEHNFSAWRKGLGRAGIGNRVIELINKPFQQILLSDSEDSDDEGINGSTNSSTKNRLQNVVDKSQPNGDTVVRPRVEERLPLHQDREAQKEKQGEITSSWMKNIEQKTTSLTNETKPENKEAGVEINRKSYREENLAKKDPPAQKQEVKEDKFTLETIKLRRVEKKAEDTKSILREKEGNFERTLSFREKLQKARERESKTLSGGFTRESPPSTPELDDKNNHDSVDSKDTQKEEENNAQTSPGQTSTDSADIDVKDEKQSEASEESEEEKAEIVDDQQETQEEPNKEIVDVEEENVIEQTDGMDQRDDSESTVSSSVADSQEIDENYDSDLDPDNEGLNEDLDTILKSLAQIKEQSADGDGFIYVFSDDANDNIHRVKIGASRFPDKKLQQAKFFNTAIKLVSAVAVSQRQRALAEVTEEFSRYQVNGNVGWYMAPLDEILENVSKVAAKYPSGQSDC